MKPQGKRPFGTGVLSLYEHYEAAAEDRDVSIVARGERAIERCGDRMYGLGRHTDILGKFRNHLFLPISLPTSTQAVTAAALGIDGVFAT